MSESSASCATAVWCRRTATASNSIGRLRRTRRSPGGSGHGRRRRNRIRGLLAVLLGFRRSRRAASRFSRGLGAVFVFLFLGLVLGHGLAQIALELVEVGLRRNTLVFVARDFVVREEDSEPALQRCLELLRVEVIVVV